MQSIIKRLFYKEGKKPALQLGRFTDNYKEKYKFSDWDNSLELYTKNDFFGSVQKFLSYLNNDYLENVVITELNHSKIKFKIYQGSKCLNGFANEDGFFAEVKIVKCDYLNIDLLKILLEKNYELQYSCFSLDTDDNICMNFYSDRESASPYKLYYGLKELATTSDKNDDVLVKKYEKIKPIADGYIIDLSEQEKNLKYEFLLNKIALTKKLLKQYELELNNHPTLKSFLILSNTLTIDYILKPEGILMEIIDRIFELSNSQNPIQTSNRLKLIEEEFFKIENLNEKVIFDELYNSKSTFGNIVSGNHLKLQETIEQEMNHFSWYLENGFKDFSLSIPSFISSNLLHNIALPLPDKLYLELLIRIMENDFFIKNGYESLIDKNNKIVKKQFLKELQVIDENCQELFSGYMIDASKIDFASIYDFCPSFLYAVKSTNPMKINV